MQPFKNMAPTSPSYGKPCHWSEFRWIDHLPVKAFITPEEFERLGRIAESLGFSSVASGPMVRSSYHADLQANPLLDSDR